jgi:hypothetical protein
MIIDTEPITLKEINPESFIYELYDPDWRGRLEYYYDSLGIPDFREIAKIAVGYCDASRLSVRPKTDEYAMMCEDDDGKFWFHLSQFMFDEVLDAIERMNGR